MEYEVEMLNKIEEMGVLNYPVDKIINVLDIDDEIQFRKDFEDPTTEVYRYYKIGADKAEFLIDSELLKLVRKGDLEAIKMFELRRENQHIG